MWTGSSSTSTGSLSMWVPLSTLFHPMSVIPATVTPRCSPTPVSEALPVINNASPTYMTVYRESSVRPSLKRQATAPNSATFNCDMKRIRCFHDDNPDVHAAFLEGDSPYNLSRNDVTECYATP